MILSMQGTELLTLCKG